MGEQAGTGSLTADGSTGARRGRREGAETAFRAAVQQRLRNLEEEVGEIKTRLNGLLFFIAGTVIAQVLLRLWG